MSTTEPPGGSPAPSPTPQDQPSPSQARQSQPMGAGRVLAIVAGSILALIAAALVLGGLAVLIGQAALRDDGYFNTPTERLVTPTRALTAERIELGDASGGGDWVVDNLDATVRVRATLAGGDPVFVGIARERDLDAYLRGVARERVRDWENGPVYVRTPGRRVPPDPAAQDFWVASASGPGTQQAQWDVEGGDWGAVVMRADAGRGIDADVRVGVKVDWITWLGVGLLIVGVVLGAGGGVLIWLGARRREPAAGGGDVSPAGPQPPP